MFPIWEHLLCVLFSGFYVVKNNTVIKNYYIIFCQGQMALETVFIYYYHSLIYSQS